MEHFNISTICLTVISIHLQIIMWIKIFFILNSEITLVIWKSYSHNISRWLSSSFLSQSQNVLKVKVSFEMSSLFSLVVFSSRATSSQKLRVSISLRKDENYIWNMAENSPSPQKNPPREAPTHTSTGWGFKEILVFLSPAFISLEDPQ